MPARFDESNIPDLPDDAEPGATPGKIPWRSARRLVKRRLPQEPDQPMEGICRALSLGRSAGETEVKRLAVECFDKVFAVEVELLTRAQRLWARIVSGLEERERALRVDIENTREFREVPDERIAWTTFNRVQLMILVLAASVALIVGMVTLSSLLMRNGDIDDWWRALTLSVVVLLMTVILEAVDRLLSSPRAKKRYAFSLFGLAAISFVVWATFMPELYGTASAGDSSGEEIEGHGGLDDLDAEEGGPPAWLLGVVMRASIGAELFGASFLFLLVARTCRAHAPVLALKNRAKAEMRRELGSVTTLQARANEFLGEFAGRISVIDSTRRGFVLRAIGEFRRRMNKIEGLTQEAREPDELPPPLRRLDKRAPDAAHNTDSYDPDSEDINKTDDHETA